MSSRTVGYIGVLSLLVQVLPGAARAECLTDHLRAAIQFNSERLPLYSRLSGGRSEPLSKLLIASEKWGLFFAGSAEARASQVRAAGIPVFCSEFVAMDQAPEWGSLERKDRPRLEDLKDWKWRAYRSQLRTILRQSHPWDEVQRVTRAAIDSLAFEPRFHCLSRHVLESIHFTAEWAKKHEEQARARSIDSRPHSLALVRLNLLGLGRAMKLDRLAAPLQAEGIPILCQDVPPIPLQ